MTNAPRLARVASYVNVAEAELARLRLAMEGIPARLDNATFVLWFWHYSNATGGVKVLVAAEHLRRARTALSSRPTPPQWQPPAWPCPKCHAEVDGLWHYCWSCGTSKDGVEDPRFFDELAVRSAHAENEILSRLAAGLTALAVVLLLMIAASSPQRIPVCGLALFIVLVVGYCCRTVAFVDAAAAVPLPGVMREPKSPFDGPDGQRLGELSYTILRTWQAAMLSLFFFPPLGLYVLWTLPRLDPPPAASPSRDRRRYWAAWAVAMITLPLGVSWLAALAWPLLNLAPNLWRPVLRY